MGLVYVTAEIGPDRERLAQVRFMVDTGSIYTFVGPDLADDLGLVLPESTTVVTANGQREEAPVGFGFLRLEGREGGILVASMDVPVPLLGSTALQVLGFRVNPVDEIVEPHGVYPPLA